MAAGADGESGAVAAADETAFNNRKAGITVRITPPDETEPVLKLAPRAATAPAASDNIGGGGATGGDARFPL